MNNFSEKYPQFIGEYSALNIYSYDSNKLNITMRLLWWCNNKHLYEASLLDRIRKRNCPFCNNKKLLENFNSLATTLPHLLKNWDYEKNKISPYKTTSSKGKFYWICENNHSWLSRVTPQIRYSFSCPYCYGRYPITGETDLATTMPESLKVWDYEKNYPTTPHDFKKFSHAKVWWKCKEKKHSYERVISKWSNSPKCPKCYGNSSKMEKEFGKELKNIYKGEIVTNSKKIIAPYELDFYLPELNVAIEFNGEYWNSDKKILERNGMTSLDYHTLKKSLCENANIKLLFLWEDDWIASKDFIFDFLSEYLNGVEEASIPNFLERLV